MNSGEWYNRKLRSGGKKNVKVIHTMDEHQIIINNVFQMSLPIPTIYIVHRYYDDDKRTSACKGRIGIDCSENAIIGFYVRNII